MEADPDTSIKPARIVCSERAFQYSSYKDTKTEVVEALMQKAENDAFQIARREGYKRMEVSTHWTLLGGDDVPTPYCPPQTLRECWALSFRDNPVARYFVIIRDMDDDRYVEASRSNA